MSELSNPLSPCVFGFTPRIAAPLAQRMLRTCWLAP
jgi:hypothetical protein